MMSLAASVTTELLSDSRANRPRARKDFIFGDASTSEKPSQPADRANGLIVDILRLTLFLPAIAANNNRRYSSAK